MRSDTNCPICYVEYDRDKCILKHGPSNTDIEDPCPHYFCVDCLRDLQERRILNCPICRKDWSEFILTENLD